MSSRRIASIERNLADAAAASVRAVDAQIPRSIGFATGRRVRESSWFPDGHSVGFGAVADECALVPARLHAR